MKTEIDIPLNEWLVIGNNIAIKIRQINEAMGGYSHQISCGIVAPKEVTVLREEIHNRINPKSSAIRPKKKVVNTEPTITIKKRRHIASATEH